MNAIRTLLEWSDIIIRATVTLFVWGLLTGSTLFFFLFTPSLESEDMLANTMCWGILFLPFFIFILVVALLCTSWLLCGFKDIEKLKREGGIK